MTEVTPNLPHFGSFCKYCFMGTLLQRQNGIHTKLYEALASGDTEVACRAVYAHYMEPMERMRSANSAVQAADEAAK